MVGGPSGSFESDWGTFLRLGTGRGILGVVQDWSGAPRRGPGRVMGPSGRSRTGWGTLREIQDGS